MPVTLTVELDEPAPVLEVGLDFEFVPAAFSLQTSSGAGKWTDVYATDCCLKKSKAEPGSRLDIKSRQQGVASRSSVGALWFYGRLIDHVPKSGPLKLASLCTEAFPKRTLKECYFQGLYL